MSYILIIEDNVTISENIALYLEAKNHRTAIASDGEKAFDMIRTAKYDFLIIDRMIPKIDGLSLVRMMQARSITIPFLFLTALGKQVDKIEWLSLGADDYLVKPFDLEELLLRIENILRRKGERRESSSKNAALSGIIIDTNAKRVTRSHIPVELSPKEYALFETLFKNRGRVLDRDFLYESVWWGYEVSPELLETINVHIAHLRKKLGGDVIRTVKLSGYIIDL